MKGRKGMSKLKQNAGGNALGLGFCLAVMGFIIFLSKELPQLRFAAMVVPFTFMSLAVLAGILKMVLLLTGSPGLKRIDELSFIKIEIPEKMKHSAAEGEKPKGVLFFIVSIFVLLGMVYLLGFDFSSFVAGFVFTYLPTKKWKKSLIIGFCLTIVSYVFSSILPGRLWSGILWSP